MKILEVGSHFQTTEKVSYKSTRRFLDFDFLILDFNDILGNQGQADGAQFFQRKNDLQEYLQHRKIPLVLFVTRHHQCHFTFPGNVGVSMAEVLPIPAFEIKIEAGTQMDILTKTPFSDFLTKYQSYFNYNSYFSSYKGTPIVIAPYTKKVLAFYNEQSIFLPPLNRSLAEKESLFLQELNAIVQSINIIPTVASLPDWTKQYYLPEEQAAVENIEKASQQIAILEEQLIAQRNFLSAIQEHKQLLVLGGKALEDAVKKIFIELGFQVHASLPDREDLILQYGDSIAVAEIKGVTGSAAERNAAQLEKWVSTYHADNNKHPKGFLIINPFKDIELIKRTGEAFPDQMLKFTMQREHCLITTVQLLGLYYSRNAPNKEQFITDLFENIGIYPHFKKWDTFIFRGDESI